MDDPVDDPMDDPKDDPKHYPKDYPKHYPKDHQFFIDFSWVCRVDLSWLFLIGGLSESRFKASAKGTPHPGWCSCDRLEGKPKIHQNLKGFRKPSIFVGGFWRIHHFEMVVPAIGKCLPYLQLC